MSSSRESLPLPLFSLGHLAVFGAAAIVAVTSARWLAASQIVTWIALVAIALAIWHGAFDGVLAEEVLHPRLGNRWKPLFYAGYLALGTAVLLLWWLVPLLALAGFLLYSALHFGTESKRQLSPARLFIGTATGFVPIAAASHWWPQQVVTIYALMLRGSAVDAVPLTALSGRLLWPVVAVALLASVANEGVHRFRPTILLVIELLLFHSCSPIVAFALFFCLWHTPEHMLGTSTDRRGRFRSGLLFEHLRRGTIPWLVSLGGVFLACWFGRHELHSYVGVVFIVLSALTVPHMVLAELCRREGNRRFATRSEYSMCRQAVSP